MIKGNGNRQRKCKNCDVKIPACDGFIAGVSFVCSSDCAFKLAVKERDKQRQKQVAKVKEEAKKERKRLAAKKQSLKPISKWMKEAQFWFNKYIRLRDKDLPCICCGRNADADIQWHAGHFLTTGARPEHRFNEDNCHKQTSYCNNHLSGNVAEYRKRLIDKIGLERVEALESDHEPKRYRADDLKAIIETYKAKCKELE